MKKIIQKWISIAVLLGLCGCGGAGGTGVANPPTSSTQNAAAAIAAIFSSEQNANISIEFEIPEENTTPKQDEQQCDNDPNCMCEYVITGESGGDRPIDDTPFAQAGSYGSFANPMEVTADDFCTQPDGIENTGSGPDGLGRFAGFTLAGEISGNCTDPDGSVVGISMLSGSTGIWRETDEQSDATPAYRPQIFGKFDFNFSGATVTYDCTIYLDENEVMLFGDCSDADGNSIDQTTEASCSF